jgi:hypothetical protein
LCSLSSALFLDVPMRLGVAALLVSHPAGQRTRPLVGLLTLALTMSQLAAFYYLFVVADVYDPTSVELLARERSFPWP